MKAGVKIALSPAFVLASNMKKQCGEKGEGNHASL